MSFLLGFLGSFLGRYFIWILGFAALVLAPAGALYFFADLRMQVWTYLGYGYIPAALWLAAFIATLTLARQSLLSRANYWIASVFGVMAVLGVLSFYYPMYGALDETGLAGGWGSYFGGYPLYLGVPKVIGAVALMIAVGAYKWALSGSKEGLAQGAGYCLAGLVVVGRTLKAWVVALWKKLTTRKQPEDAPAPAAADLEPERSPSIFAAAARTPEPPPWEEPEDFLLEDQAIPSEWKLPSFDLLADGETDTVPEETLQQMAETIESTMSDHGVEVSVREVKTGPRVLRFGISPGRIKRNRDARSLDEGGAVDMGRVKVQSIMAREADLALALKTPDLRIQSQVPGEGFVGMEVPNPNPSIVTMKAVATHPEFAKIMKKGGLPLALGQGTGGEPVIADLVGLPHLLVAGSTGSGKSVCINSLVMSLLLSNPPDRLRMLMVDPKRVELTPFNGIPHLYAPVIVDPDDVLDVLAALLREMFHRYKLMEDIGVRNIEGYNQKVKEQMPFSLLIIDELADLMMTSGFEVEQSLVRLAQLGRATGIHLILCTQRPSVKVVTGLLKANIPGRIAFAVASQVDSRVILDGSGADKLLGKGDMLFLSAQSPAPQRIQGAYVDDSEFEAVIEFWKAQKGPPLPGMALEEAASEAEAAAALEDDADEMLLKAREMCEKYQHLSPAMLQRRLQIGYARAMELLEMLEAEGVLGAGDPGKSRQVIDSGATTYVD